MKSLIKMVLTVVMIAVVLGIICNIGQKFIDDKALGTKIKSDGSIVVKKQASVSDDLPAGRYKMYHNNNIEGLVIVKSSVGTIRYIYSIRDFFDDFEDGDEITLREGDSVIFTGGYPGITLVPSSIYSVSENS